MKSMVARLRRSIGVRPMIETWPLAEASKAVDVMMDARVRLGTVVETAV